MARTVKLGAFQEMQRGELDADRAVANGGGKLDPLSGGLTNDKRPPGFRQPALSVAEQLQALDLSDHTPDMPLGQVVGLVRLAVAEKHINATEQEIRAEGERRWLDGKLEESPPVEPKPEDREESDSLVSTLDESTVSETGARVSDSSSPIEYDVEPDGLVAEVRAAEMTPDRGDVTHHHTVSDPFDSQARSGQAEARFSGGGADDAESTASALIPTDQQFAGKLYRDAPELANIAEKLIGEHGFLSELINAEIRYYWRRKTGVSKGRVKIGYCKRASDLLGHFSGADFLIWLSATTARDGKFTDRQIEAAVFHQLLHIETDDEGNFISARHDFEGFAQEIRHYGTWTEDLKLVVPAVDAARQMGLFDVDDEGIDADDEEDERDDFDDGNAYAGDGPDLSGEIVDTDDIEVRAGDVPI